MLTHPQPQVHNQPTLSQPLPPSERMYRRFILQPQVHFSATTRAMVARIM